MLYIGDKAAVASLDVDAQKGFTPLCPEELPIPEGHTIVEALNQQARFAKYRLGSKDAHPLNPVWLANPTQPMLTPLPAEHADKRWPLHCIGCAKLHSLKAPPRINSSRMGCGATTGWRHKPHLRGLEEGKAGWWCL